MNHPEKELAEIKTIMERSTRFLSLSGLSGVIAGALALIGAGLAYYWVYYPYSPFSYRTNYVNSNAVLIKLCLTAFSVLALSLIAGFVLTKRKQLKSQTQLWNSASRRFLLALFIPLLAGGIFILALMLRGYLMVIAPASLLFYGLALLNASHHTHSDIKYLGYCQIATGLLSAFFPGYGLIFWAFGFGVLHIVYGFSMHLKYDK